MSPADAKRGAKRRKNKRGGGGGSGGGGSGGKAGSAAALRGPQAPGPGAAGLLGGAAAHGPLGAGAGGAAGGYFEGQDFLLHSSLGGSQPETSGAGRLALGTQTMTSSGLGTTPSDACSCEACSERRDISAETEREPQQLQNYWSEVRYMVRCIYRQAGTPLAEDQDQSLVPDKEGVKELVDRLCERDPYQLYQRLEQQAREYVLEMKVRLLRQLSAAAKAKAPSGLQGPPQAHHFVSLLLEEYAALCQAARSISS